jgi:hypothetical protein
VTPAEFASFASMVSGAEVVLRSHDSSVLFLNFGTERVFVHDRTGRQVGLLQAPSRERAEVIRFVEGHIAAAAREPGELPHEVLP